MMSFCYNCVVLVIIVVASLATTPIVGGAESDGCCVEEADTGDAAECGALVSPRSTRTRTKPQPHDAARNQHVHCRNWERVRKC